jgi:hypothetical protein
LRQEASHGIVVVFEAAAEGNRVLPFRADVFPVLYNNDGGSEGLRLRIGDGVVWVVVAVYG